MYVLILCTGLPYQLLLSYFSLRNNILSMGQDHQNDKQGMMRSP